MALTEKQKNCPYCHPGSKIEGFNNKSPWEDAALLLEQVNNANVSVGHDTWGDIEFDPINGDLASWADGTDPLIVKIHYCPMCGRPLNEEEE